MSGWNQIPASVLAAAIKEREPKPEIATENNWRRIGEVLNEKATTQH